MSAAVATQRQEQTNKRAAEEDWPGSIYRIETPPTGGRLLRRLESCRDLMPAGTIDLDRYLATAGYRGLPQEALHARLSAQFLSPADCL